MISKTHIFYLRSSFLPVVFLVMVAILLLNVTLAQGRSNSTSTAQDTANNGVDNTVFLPIVLDGRFVSGTENKPLPPESYPSEDSMPPTLAIDPNATACASFIDFTNFSDETVYIFWVGENNEEFLYKILGSGRHYWQHTYRFNEWRIRDDAANLLRTIIVDSCENGAENIFVDDLPPCGGILNIGLHDLNNDEPIANYETLEDGMTIDLGQLPPVVIHIEAQDTVESIEVIGGGSVLALNDLPYHYPPSEGGWLPRAGLVTLVFNAYRKDDAAGKICDTIELSMLILNTGTPTATATAVITPTAPTTGTPTPTATATIPTQLTPTPTATVVTPPTVTPTASPTPTQEQTPTATPSWTPTPTATVPACQGQIDRVRLFDIAAQAPLAGYDPLTSGMTIALDEIFVPFNIDTSISGTAQSVLYVVNGIASLENAAPFRYPGGDVNPWEPTPGAYTIRVTAYESIDATGTICAAETVQVTVVDTLATPTPTATATPTAMATATATPDSTPTPTPTQTMLPTATPDPLLTCLGDQTWIDQNEDGIQNNEEPGLDGIDIYLWADDNRDGLPDRIVSSATTAGGGYYEFCALQSTITYLIEFGTNAQCRFTLSDQGNDERVDSDADALKGLSAPLQPINGAANHTVDAGYVCGTVQ